MEKNTNKTIGATVAAQENATTQAATMTASQVWNHFKNEYEGRAVWALFDVVLAQLGGLGNNDVVDADVLRELAEIRDAANGYTGFIYYSETCDFYEKNRAAIIALAREEADELGAGGPLSLISGFSYFNNKARKFDEDVTALTLYSNREQDHDTEISNLLSWYALEEVAFHFDNFAHDFKIDLEHVVNDN